MRNFAGLLLALLMMLSPSTLKAADGCPDSGLITKAKLLTAFCYDCIFPMTLAGEALPTVGFGRPASNLPDKGVSRWAKPFIPCVCPGRMGGFPTPGMPFGYWQPTHLHETVGTPFCSPLLGGLSLTSGMGGAAKVLSSIQQGRQHAKSESGFYNWHWVKFPMAAAIDVLTNLVCINGAGFDLDYGYMTEIDFSYQSEVLANLFAPWGKAFSNPVAEPIAMADKVMTSVRKPLEAAVHSAGSNGRLYPLSGHGPPDSSFEGQMRTAMRGLTLAHSRGLATKSSGPAAICKSRMWFVFPKQQYQIQNLWPRAQRRAMWSGATELRSGWGVGRTIPFVGEDRVQFQWTYKECCVHW